MLYVLLSSCILLFYVNDWDENVVVSNVKILIFCVKCTDVRIKIRLS